MLKEISTGGKRYELVKLRQKEIERENERLGSLMARVYFTVSPRHIATVNNSSIAQSSDSASPEKTTLDQTLSPA
jgi:hypothetical protein